jgi:hypothetical protein
MTFVLNSQNRKRGKEREIKREKRDKKREKEKNGGKKRKEERDLGFKRWRETLTRTIKLKTTLNLLI